MKNSNQRNYLTENIEGELYIDDFDVDKYIA